MSRRAVLCLRFADLAIGDEWISPGRTVTEADVAAFAGLSGDFNPLHTDHEAARHGPFRQPVAHGLLSLAIASGLTSHAPRVDTLAFLAILDWKFLEPVAFGDTIHVVSEIVALEPRARGRRGIVTWRRSIVNQTGVTVQVGLIQTMVRGDPRQEQDEEPEEAVPSADSPGPPSGQ